MPATTLERNLGRVYERVERAARAAGRDPAEVRLLAVTKGVDLSLALALARLGVREFGESRVEGLDEKAVGFERAGAQASWHFIGHLQRNKVRRVLRRAAAVHSVDSTRLVDALERIAAEDGRAPDVYLEVKLSHEDSKHGLEPAELPDAVRRAAAAPHLRLRGLMTMAPLAAPPELAPGAPPDAAARPVFDELARLARELEGDAQLSRAFADRRVELSMGMSGDLEAAVAAGSHVVRVGGALFEGLGAPRREEREEREGEVHR